MQDASVVISIEPSNMKALYRRALAFEALNDYSAAHVDAEELCKLDSRNEEASALRKRLKELISKREADEKSIWTVENSKRKAIQFLEENRPDKAIPVLVDALALSIEPAMSSDTRIGLLHLLVSAHFAVDKLEDAVESCKNIISIDKNNFKAHLRLAETYMKLVS